MLSMHHRKRRLYACQDIQDLVCKQGLDFSQLSRQPPEYWEHIEVFDDTDYETRHAEQWVPRIPGKAGVIGVALEPARALSMVSRYTMIIKSGHLCAQLCHV